MLGADLVGFHLQQYGNNFLDTVDRVLESRLDWDHFAVELRAELLARAAVSYQRPALGRAPRTRGRGTRAANRGTREQHQLGDAFVAVGVDRIDYTKGLPGRFRAVAHAPRSIHPVPWAIHARRARRAELTHSPLPRALWTGEALAEEINWQFRTDDWKPIRFLVAHHDAKTVHALRMAPMGIVSSLHDGMNLVAKEYDAAQAGGDGVLILSRFAGAARGWPTR